jgi:hypothetical protein
MLVVCFYMVREMCCKVQQGLAKPSFRNRLTGSIPVSPAKQRKDMTTEQYWQWLRDNVQ